MIRVQKTPPPRGLARPPRVIRIERRPPPPPVVAAEVIWEEQPPQRLLVAEGQPPLPPEPMLVNRPQVPDRERLVDLDQARFYQSLDRWRLHHFEDRTVIPFEKRNGAILLATSDPEEIRYLHRYSGPKTQIKEISRKDYDFLSNRPVIEQTSVEPPPCWIYWSTNATQPIALKDRFLKFTIVKNDGMGAFSGCYITQDVVLANTIALVIAGNPCVREINRAELEHLSGMVLQLAGEVVDAY